MSLFRPGSVKWHVAPRVAFAEGEEVAASTPISGWVGPSPPYASAAFSRFVGRRSCGRAIQLFNEPIQLSARGGNGGTVSGKGGFLAGVFVLQFRVNLSANDDDLQTHAESAGERIGIFVRLRFGLASHRH